MNNTQQEALLTHDEVEDLEAQFSAAMEPELPPTPRPAPRSNNLGEWALWYHDVGYWVGEDLPKSKHHAKHHETDKGYRKTRSQILSAWDCTPDANISLRLGWQRGAVANMVVLDADGFNAALYVVKQLGALGIKAPMVMNGKFTKVEYVTGIKFFFKLPDGVDVRKCRINLPVCRNVGHDGLELLGNGSRAIVAPSVHPDKEDVGNGVYDHKKYRWIHPLPSDPNDLPELPQHFLDLPRSTTEMGKATLAEDLLIRQTSGIEKTVAEWRQWMKDNNTTRVGSLFVPASLRDGREDRGHSGYMMMRSSGSVTFFDDASGLRFRDGIYERKTEAPAVNMADALVTAIKAEPTGTVEKLSQPELEEEKKTLAGKAKKRAKFQKQNKQKLDNRRRNAENLDPLRVKLAKDALELAREWEPVIRKHLKLRKPSHRCGFYQLITDAKTLNMMIVHRECSKLTCYFCAPKLLGIKASSIALGPIVDDSGSIVAGSLVNHADRGQAIHRYQMNDKALPLWIRRSKRSNDRVASYIEKGSTTQVGHSVFVAFRGDGQDVTVLSTVKLEASRKGGAGAPVDTIEGSKELRKAILDLTLATYRVDDRSGANVIDLAPGNDFQAFDIDKQFDLPPLVKTKRRVGQKMVGRITCTQGLCLDPDEVLRISSNHSWLMEEPHVVDPKAAEKILADMGVMGLGMRLGDESVPTLITGGFEDQALRKRIGDALRVGASQVAPEETREDEEAIAASLVGLDE